MTKLKCFDGRRPPPGSLRRCSCAPTIIGGGSQAGRADRTCRPVRAAGEKYPLTVRGAARSHFVPATARQCCDGRFWDGCWLYSAICILSRSNCLQCRMRCFVRPASRGGSSFLCGILRLRLWTARFPPLALFGACLIEEIIERLSQVRGIGTWTAEMLLIFRLGRPDVFPGTDYGIRKGYLLTFGRVKAGKPITLDMLPKAEQMQRRAARWKPWRSVASWYLWRACELRGTPSGGKIPLS